ncbi:MAG: arginine decarboxylase, pyruvoyl-dependent [Thermoplasmata archaeon]|jgi:arginine decarboxylase|nr:arginine decarboxylase, pyruvoyl-dependent [Euryarchaeota archaeon]MVT14056.1 arginine decarboxylase, pyruvoyl-dependent [Euryarchaeota archaeon]MVT35783.1 arginine decarboxylase, pyruvoyl-dependent [Euryarchaeota archaeon]
MFTIIPSKVFFTKGVGRHKSRLGSFEQALRDAGIAQFNLVEVSSIFPPNAEIVTKEEGLKYLKPGQILFVVLAKNSSDEYNRLISAAVGLAIPKDRNLYGYLSEHHSFGETDKVAGEFAEDLAAEMLASTMGIDHHLIWDENSQNWKLDDRILLTQNIASSATVERSGEWTTVIAAAVLIP